MAVNESSTTPTANLSIAIDLSFEEMVSLQLPLVLVVLPEISIVAGPISTFIHETGVSVISACLCF